MNEDKSKTSNEVTDSEDDSLLGMFRLFYTREMMPLVVILWITGLVAMALMIFSAVRFFGAESMRGQIMFAVIFLTATHMLAMVKILAWQLMNRNSLRRRLQRLELMIQDMKNKR